MIEGAAAKIAQIFVRHPLRVPFHGEEGDKHGKTH
jgi:hypothetical protein